MIELDALAQLLAQLEAESIAELIRALQHQLMNEAWVQWTIQSINEGYKHITDLSWLPRCGWFC